MDLRILRTVALAVLTIGWLTACEDADDEGNYSQNLQTAVEQGTQPDQPEAAPPANDAPEPETDEQPVAPVAPASGNAIPADFGGVVWLHTDVSGWAQTASLDARISGSSMILDYNKAYVWPEVDGVNANPWIFVFQDGVWYAATWEWLRYGQTSKPLDVINGDHIKKSPLQNFRPQSGALYGFMVSGLARDDKRNVKERSNVDMVRWP